MSNTINTNLMEQAADAIDRWVGTPWVEVLEGDLERLDMESLSFHLLECAREENRQEQQESSLYKRPYKIIGAPYIEPNDVNSEDIF